jgi:hypothetical protein
MAVAWFREVMTNVMKSYIRHCFTVTQDIGTASSFSRHRSQMGLFVDSNLERCPFNWQCPVSGPAPFVAGLCSSARTFSMERSPDFLHSVSCGLCPVLGRLRRRELVQVL